MVNVEKYFRKTFRFSGKSTESYSCKFVPHPTKLVRDASLLRGDLILENRSIKMYHFRWLLLITLTLLLLLTTVNFT